MITAGIYISEYNISDEDFEKTFNLLLAGGILTSLFWVIESHIIVLFSILFNTPSYSFLIQWLISTTLFDNIGASSGILAMV